MPQLKSILESRTLWANFIGFCALILSMRGFPVSPEVVDQSIEAVLQVVTGLSLLLSSFFRIIATKRLSA
jgi:hypothetical protein